MSRYASGATVYPHPAQSADAFIAGLLDLVTHDTYDLVVPVTDWTIGPLLAHRATIEAHAPLALGPTPSVLATQSKSRTEALARSLGIPTPRTLVVTGAAEPDVAALEPASRWRHPLVVKADTSKVFAPDGSGVHTTATYAETPLELVRALRLLAPVGPRVVQEYVEGEGVGLGVLASHGQLLVAFQYRRLHEVPLTGGGSSYRVSEPLDPTIVGHARALLSALDWTGVAMLEFRRSKDGSVLSLLEINGRFWGSLALAIASGVDFPALAWDLLVLEQPPAVHDYRVGQRCRDLDSDLRWLRGALRPRDVPEERRPRLTSIVTDTVRLLDPREAVDSLALDDPTPSLASLVETASDIAAVATRHLNHRAQLLRHAAEQRFPTRLQAELRRARSLLMVCHGNIIRSAYAAAALRQRLGPSASLTVASAGLAADEGVSAHELARQVALERGVDLDVHQARRATAAILTEVDLVIVMDVEQWNRAVQLSPSTRSRVHLLGAFSPHVRLEVVDPIGGGTASVVRCFDHIDQVIASMVSLLTR